MTSVTDADKRLFIAIADKADHDDEIMAGHHFTWEVSEIARHRLAARNAALEEAAQMAEWSHMVPPDGGSPSADECRVAFEAARSIRALMTKEN